jgi:cell division protein FtsW
MTEALRFPWGNDDPARPRPRPREAAAGAARPRSANLASNKMLRTQARRPAARRGSPGVTRASLVRPLPGPASLPQVGRGARPRPPSPGTLGGPGRDLPRDRVSGWVVQGPQRERHEPDYVVMVAAVALTAIGILMIYSSEGIRAALSESGSVFDAVATQLLWALTGGIVLVVLMRMDYRYLRHFALLGFAIAVGLLVLVFVDIPPLIEQRKVGNAARWLRIGGLPPFHPAEIAKLALIVYLAHWLAKRGTEIGSLRRGTIPFMVVVLPVVALIALEPDLGTTGVVTLTAFTMFFVAGASLWQLALLVPVGIAGLALYVQGREYQLQRVLTFLDPFAAERDSGYQTVQGLYALALGGVTGIGLGESRPGAGGLPVPNANNDFIFAVVGQELGLVGGITVIGLFLVLAWRGMRIALAAPDTFGGLLALGVTAWLSFQAFINIGVVVNLVPLTGLPLPFLSDGGTSLVVSLAAVGILLAISRETVSRGSGSHEDRGGSGRHRRPHLPRLGRAGPAVHPSP